MIPSALRFPHLVIRASAGTGKTYQLSNRFIGLAAAGHLPDQILAATFARKAAGEILDRVLTRLAKAVAEPTQLALLADSLEDATFDRARCLRLLQGLVRRLHRLRIGTLDSFFLQMAGGFSLELGLPPGWGIIDELTDDNLRSVAVQMILEGESTTDLLTLLHLLNKGEAARSVTSQIVGTVQELYDLHCESPPEAWRKLPRYIPLSDAEVRNAIIGLRELAPFSDKNLAKAHDKHVRNAELGDWEAFATKGFVGAIVSGAGIYYKKPIAPAVVDAYAPLVEHARAVLVGQLANQTEAAQRLLEKFDGVYRRLKFRSRGLRFEDVTRSLAEGLSSQRMRQLTYRLDAHVAHLLLDEFQDTSLSQWGVVRPFAEEVVAPGTERSFFCVGDVKQAIYAWRGGVSEIFDTVDQQLAGIEKRHLSRSYRSSPIIIDAVNACFTSLDANQALLEFPEVVETWKRRFVEPHSTAKEKLPGYCRMVVAPRAEGTESQPNVTLAFAAKEVARIAQERPDLSIGVLVRKNAAVARLIYELRSRQNVMASEEGGNPLTDSAAVQLVLSLLRLADHPGDTAARFHVATSRLGAIVGLERDAGNARVDTIATDIRDRLMNDGYGRTIYAWVQGLAVDCDSRELSRLQQFVELAYLYDQEASLRTDDFIWYIEQTRVEDPTAANLRVMTIHQAKGLEFDIVVLPELDHPLKERAPRAVVGRDGLSGPVKFVSRYANETVQSLLPEELQEIFQRWGSQSVNDSLCLLYVAMTRAVHALQMIVPPSADSEKNPPKTFAGVLRSALAEGKPALPGELLYEHGSHDWHRKVETRSKAAKRDELDGAKHPPVETIDVQLRQSSSRRERGLDRKSPSSLEGGNKINLASRLRMDGSHAANRGTVVHAWFEQIAWLDDFRIDEEALLAVAGPLADPDLDLEAELGLFRKMLIQPAIGSALSRAAYDDPAALGFSPDICRELKNRKAELQLWRERPFAILDGDDLLNGAIDRVVVLRQGNQPIAADILDFKTDSIADDAAVAAKIEFYRPQIAAYRRAVSRLLGLDPNRVTSRLLFVGPGIVSPLS